MSHLTVSRRQFVGSSLCGGAFLLAGKSAGQDAGSLMISNCTERVADIERSDASSLKLLADEYEEVQQLAFDANPANEEGFIASMPLGAPMALPSDDAPEWRQQIALTKSLLWGKIDVLRIRLISTPPTNKIRDAIIDAMATWEEHVPFELKLTNSSPDIKIDFQPSGHWSYVGISSKRHIHSMNLQPNIPDENYFRVALHEFGHALGAVHEHQQPNAGIDWNKAAVYAYYKRTQNWDRGMVDRQVLNKYSDPNGVEFNASEYDPNSIMQYPIPRELLNSGEGIPWRDKLSSLDMKFITESYGGTFVEKPNPDTTKPTEPDVVKVRRADLPVGSTGRVGEAINKPGEAVLYTVKIETAGTYHFETIESNPSITMKLTLFNSPDVTQPPRASNHHGGARLLNARIVQENLPAGTYYVLAEHYFKTQSSIGKFDIRAYKP